MAVAVFDSLVFANKSHNIDTCSIHYNTNKSKKTNEQTNRERKRKRDFVLKWSVFVRWLSKQCRLAVFALQTGDMSETARLLWHFGTVTTQPFGRKIICEQQRCTRFWFTYHVLQISQLRSPVVSFVGSTRTARHAVGINKSGAIVAVVVVAAVAVVAVTVAFVRVVVVVDDCLTFDEEDDDTEVLVIRVEELLTLLSSLLLLLLTGSDFGRGGASVTASGSGNGGGNRSDSDTGGGGPKREPPPPVDGDFDRWSSYIFHELEKTETKQQ